MEFSSYRDGETVERDLCHSTVRLAQGVLAEEFRPMIGMGLRLEKPRTLFDRKPELFLINENRKQKDAIQIVFWPQKIFHLLPSQTIRQIISGPIAIDIHFILNELFLGLSAAKLHLSKSLRLVSGFFYANRCHSSGITR